MNVHQDHLRRINLNHLYPLEAILNAPSLTEAGRRVSLSQPAMSQALRKLREMFDDELVVYGRADYRLTPLAEALRPRIRLLLQEITATFALTLEFDPTRSTRTFTVAAPEALEIMLLGRMIPRLLRAAPNVRVLVMPFDHGSALRAFETGADVIVVPGRFADPRFERRELMADTPACMIWDARADMPGELSAADYAAARHAAVYDPLWPAAHLDAASQALLATRNVVVRTSVHAALPGLVIGSDLVVTASGWLLQHYASMMPLKVVPFPLPTQPEPIIAQWPGYRDGDAAHAWLLNQIVASTSWFGG